MPSDAFFGGAPGTVDLGTFIVALLAKGGEQNDSPVRGEIDT
jgi:hypothetical protein